MTSSISRTWATPLTIGVFALMAVTGILMFFHLDTALQKLVHEWAGWLMVAAVALHAVANWFGFKRYFTQGGQAAAILGASVLAVALSFFIPLGGGDGGGSPPQLAIGALTRAPIAQVAPLFGKSAAQARADLAAAGIALDRDDASLESVLGKDRERMGAALRALARKG